MWRIHLSLFWRYHSTCPSSTHVSRGQLRPSWFRIEVRKQCLILMISHPGHQYSITNHLNSPLCSLHHNCLPCNTTAMDTRQYSRSCFRMENCLTMLVLSDLYYQQSGGMLWLGVGSLAYTNVERKHRSKYLVIVTTNIKVLLVVMEHNSSNG